MVGYSLDQIAIIMVWVFSFIDIISHAQRTQRSRIVFDVGIRYPAETNHLWAEYGYRGLLVNSSTQQRLCSGPWADPVASKRWQKILPLVDTAVKYWLLAQLHLLCLTYTEELTNDTKPCCINLSALICWVSLKYLSHSPRWFFRFRRISRVSRARPQNALRYGVS